MFLCFGLSKSTALALIVLLHIQHVQLRSQYSLSHSNNIYLETIMLVSRWHRLDGIFKFSLKFKASNFRSVYFLNFEEEESIAFSDKKNASAFFHVWYFKTLFGGGAGKRRNFHCNLVNSGPGRPWKGDLELNRFKISRLSAKIRE